MKQKQVFARLNKARTRSFAGRQPSQRGRPLSIGDFGLIRRQWRAFNADVAQPALVSPLPQCRLNQRKCQPGSKSNFTDHEVLLLLDQIQQAGAFEIDVGGFLNALVLKVPITMLCIDDLVVFDHEVSGLNPERVGKSHAVL